MPSECVQRDRALSASDSGRNEPLAASRCVQAVNLSRTVMDYLRDSMHAVNRGVGVQLSEQDDEQWRQAHDFVSKLIDGDHGCHSTR